MLRTNTHLVVLDLTNTAILHEGALAVLSSLGYTPDTDIDTDTGSAPDSLHGVNRRVNTTLRHLYMDSNGLQIKTAKLIAGYLSSKHGQSHLRTLSLACNRFGDEGTQYIATALHQDTSVQRVVLASVGMGVAGAESLAQMLAVNTTILHLDLGLLKSTAALSELPNRLGNEGAIAIASSLRVNTTLRSLSLVYNNIRQLGLDALKTVLSGSPLLSLSSSNTESNHKHTPNNTTLIKLAFEQIGVPFNEFTREAIKLGLQRNALLLSEQEKEVVEEAVNPSHLREIVSVYRVNGNYAH